MPLDLNSDAVELPRLRKPGNDVVAKPAQVDLTFIGRDALNKATGGLTGLFVVGAAYLVITIPLGFLARWLERRTGGGHRP